MYRENTLTFVFPKFRSPQSFTCFHSNLNSSAITKSTRSRDFSTTNKSFRCEVVFALRARRCYQSQWLPAFECLCTLRRAISSHLSPNGSRAPKTSSSCRIIITTGLELLVAPAGIYLLIPTHKHRRSIICLLKLRLLVPICPFWSVLSVVIQQLI